MSLLNRLLNSRRFPTRFVYEGELPTGEVDVACIQAVGLRNVLEIVRELWQHLSSSGIIVVQGNQEQIASLYAEFSDRGIVFFGNRFGTESLRDSMILYDPESWETRYCLTRNLVQGTVV